MGLDFKINFPNKISGTFEISISTTSQAEIENLKFQMIEYVQWSLTRFNQGLLAEAKLLNSNLEENTISAPLYISQVSSSNIVVKKKSKTKMMIILSVLLGLIIGSIIVLIRNTIKARYS